MRIIYIIFTLFLSFSALALPEQESVVESKIQESPSLPSFLKEVSPSLSTFNNSVFYNQLMEKKSLENYDSRFIILHFWATWCMECQNELIAINKLQKEFRKKSLLVIAISEDFKEVSAIDEYFTKHKIDFLDIYLDKKNDIYRNLNINHLPASYLIDFNGDVIAKSSAGVWVDWGDEDLKKYLEFKVSKHQLLPPEFKSERELYQAPKEIKKEVKEQKQDKEINKIIN